MKRPLDRFGDVPLEDLERMTDEVAEFIVALPDRWRHPVVLAFRHTLDAGIRYGYLTRNPAKLAGPNPEPAPRAIRVYTPEELERLCAELDKLGSAVVRFAASTGLRPAEWAATERRDVDRKRRVLTVRGTKTLRSRREVALTSEALAALDSVTPRMTRPTSSRRSVGGRSTSRTSADVTGETRSKAHRFLGQRASTTYVRRSSPTHSHEGSPCSRRLGSPEPRRG